jgi:small nuclear ribonucleoprotein (snRNP)-like protein
MNVKLSEVTITNQSGEKFFKTGTTYLRGNGIRSIQFKEDVLKETID